MAINQNHLFEDLEGIKCAVVEKNASKERVAFLQKILEYNRYKVIVAPSPPPKAAPPPAVAADPATAAVLPLEPPSPPETFTVGVTDVMFNATNAIFGRLLKLPGGHIVTLAFWQQKDDISHDEIPYFDRPYHN